MRHLRQGGILLSTLRVRAGLDYRETFRNCSVYQKFRKKV